MVTEAYLAFVSFFFELFAERIYEFVWGSKWRSPAIE
jgi:hypothetical protein